MARSFLSTHLATLNKLISRRDLVRRLSEIHNQLAYTPYSLTLLEEQAEICEQLSEPNDIADAFRELGQAYVRRGLYARAIATFNRLLELNPECTGVHAELAALISKQRADRSQRSLNLDHTDPGIPSQQHEDPRQSAPAGGEVRAAEPAVPPPVLAEPDPPLEESGVPTPQKEQAPTPPPPFVQASGEPAASDTRTLSRLAASPDNTQSSRPVSAIWIEADPIVPPAEALEEEKDLPDQEKEARSNERATSVLFELFQPEALEEVLASTCLRNWGDGEIIFREGDPGSSMFLLVDGRVQIIGIDRKGVEVEIDNLGAGEIFGGVSVVNDRPRAATVRAVHWVTAIEISKARIHAIAEEHPHILDVLRGFVEERAQKVIDVLVHGQDPAVRQKP